jgi:hypothetical protein
MSLTRVRSIPPEIDGFLSFAATNDQVLYNP